MADNKRRLLLKSILGGAALPMDMLISSIVSGILNTASAASNGNQPLNYILVNLVDAPPRWPMDLILKPNDNSPFVPNPMIVTQFDQIGSGPLDISFRYATHKINGIHFPSMWGETTPSRSGGERAIAPLAQNSLIIRGCDMGIDGHVRNNMRLAAPNQGGLSIGGQIADFSSRPIPTICLSGELGFNNNAAAAFLSKSGKIPVDIDDRVDDYFKFLIDPFYSKKVLGYRGNHLRKEFVKKSTQMIRQQLKKARTNQDYYSSVSNIEALVERSLESLDGDYQRLVAKYQDLVTRSLRKTKIKGVTDRKIPGVKLPLSVDPKTKPKVVDDVVGIFKNEAEIFGDDDLRNIFNRSKIINLANQFAIAELAFKHQLTSSIVLNVNPITFLDYQMAYPTDNLELINDPGKSLVR